MANAFTYSATAELNWKRNLSDFSGYEPQYTFYSDFSIAEFCEVFMKDREAVRKTYKKVLKEWGKNIKAITEAVMVLNHKIWSFHDKVDSKLMGCSDETAERLAVLYDELYHDCDEWIAEHYKDDKEALNYYYQTTD